MKIKFVLNDSDKKTINEFKIKYKRALRNISLNSKSQVYQDMLNYMAALDLSSLKDDGSILSSIKDFTKKLKVKDIRTLDAIYFPGMIAALSEVLAMKGLPINVSKYANEIYDKAKNYMDKVSSLSGDDYTTLSMEVVLDGIKELVDNIDSSKGDFNKLKALALKEMAIHENTEEELYKGIVRYLKSQLKATEKIEKQSGSYASIIEDTNFPNLKDSMRKLIKLFDGKNPRVKGDKNKTLKLIEDDMNSIRSAQADLDNFPSHIPSLSKSEGDLKDYRKHLVNFKNDLSAMIENREDLSEDEVKLLEDYIKEITDFQKEVAPIKKETTKSYDDFIKRIPTIRTALKNAMNDKENAVEILTKAGIPTPLKDDTNELLKSVVQKWNDTVGKFLPEAKSEDDIKSINELAFELKSYYDELEAKSKEKRLLEGPLKDLQEYSDFCIQLDVLMNDIISERKRLAEESVRNNFIVKSLGKLTANRTKNAIAELEALPEGQEEDPETAEKVDAILKKYSIKVKEPFLTVKELISNLKKLEVPEKKWVEETSKWFNENKLAFDDEIESFQALVKKLESIVAALEKMSSDGNYESLSPDNKSTVESLTKYYKLSLKFIKDYLSALEKQFNITSEVVSLVGAGLGKASKAAGKSVNVTLDATKKVMSKKIGIDK